MAHRPPPHIGPTPTSASDSARPGPIIRSRRRPPHIGPRRGDRTEIEDILEEFGEGPSPQQPHPLEGLPAAARAPLGSRAYDAQLARLAIQSPEGQQARAKAMLAEADRLQKEADAKLAREKERRLGLRFQPLGVPEPEIPPLVQLKINKLNSNAAKLQRGDEPSSLPAAYQNLLQTIAAQVTVVIAQSTPGKSEIEVRANDLEAQGYSKGQAAKMAWYASNLYDVTLRIPGDSLLPIEQVLLKTGVIDKPITGKVNLRTLIEFAADPFNYIPVIGIGPVGVLRKLTRNLGALKNLAGTTAGAVRQAEVANLSKAVVRRLQRIDTSARKAIEQTAISVKAMLGPRTTAPGISRLGPIPSISGGAPAAEDLTTVFGLNQTIKHLDTDIKKIEGLGGDAPKLVETRQALLTYKENVLESALGEDDYRAYVKLRMDLDEVRAFKQAGRGTGSGLAPPRGTEARARWDELRDERMAAIEARGGTLAKRPRESITALKKGIAEFEERADQIVRVEDALPPPGPDRYAPPGEELPPTQRGTLQTGMGIGETPPQGALFDETPIGGEVGQLADPEQLASLQAAREAVERGQQVLPEPLVGQAKLPRDLAGAKPNYNMGHLKYTPKFASDVDRALFIVSQTKKSARDESYMGWLREQLPNLPDTELRATGREVRAHIKTTLKGQPEGDVAIPLSRVVRELGVRPTAAAAGAPPAVPVTPGMPSAEAEKALRKAVQDVTGGTPPTINGVPTGEVIPPSHITDVATADEQAASMLHHAIPESRLDVLATGYLRSPDPEDIRFKRLVANLRSADPGGQQLLIPGLTPPPPKSVPVAKEFFEAMDEDKFSKLSRLDGRSTDPTRLLQKLDSGVFNGAAQKFILHPTRQAYLASLRYGDEKVLGIKELFGRHNMRGRPRAIRLRRLSTEIAQFVDTKAAGKDAQEILAIEKVAEKLRGLPVDARLRVVRVAQEARLWYDDTFKQINDVRAARGQRLIPYLENYVQWIHDQHTFSILGFRKSAARDVADSPYFIDPEEAFNPRELERGEGNWMPDAMETDLQKLMANYSESARRDIFHTEIIRNARAYTRALRQKEGFDVTADVVDNWISEVYAGTKSKLDEAVEGDITAQLAGMVYGIKRRLMRAVFPLNWRWNFATQTSSIVPTLARFGVPNTIRGLDYVFSPAARRWTREFTYSSIIKGRRAGKVSRQDAGGVGERSLSLDRNLMETVEDWANFLTNTIEDNLTGISNRAAFHDGSRRLGLTGRALAEYASEGGAKTQSMYNLQDVSGWGRSQVIQTLFPFQTFVIDMFNNVREMGFLLGKGKTGIYETVASDSIAGRALMKNRIKQALTFAGGMYATNLLGDRLLNRKPWQVSSFLPFYAMLSGAMSPFGSGLKTLPGEYVSDFNRGIMDLVQTGSFTKLRKFMLGYHMIAGTQANLTIDGLIAVSKGEVTDRGGRLLFEVGREEWLTAITQGPYGTKEGKKYIDGLRAEDGAFAEWIGKFGVLVQDGWPVGRKLATMEQMFGEEVMGDDGVEKTFTTKDFGALVREKVVELDRFWDKPSAMQQSSQDGDALWKEYDTINEDKEEKERIAWRREHPETDASLFFWGRVKTLQSKEALDLVTEMMTRFDVPENGVKGYDRERVLRPYYDAGQPQGALKRLWEAFQAYGPFEQDQMRQKPGVGLVIKGIESKIEEARKALRDRNPAVDVALVLYGLSMRPQTKAGEIVAQRLLDKERKEREEAKKRDEEKRDEEELDPAVLAGAK
jgi:hypothetical protein